MGWRKNFCYWLIITGEVHRVLAAVRKHEPGSAGQDEAKEPKKQIGATPPIYDTFESEPDVLECWRYECLAKGFGGRCNFFDGGKWIGNTCKDFGEGSEKRSYLDILNRVIASFSFEDIGSLTSQVEEAAPAAIKNLFLWLKDQLPSTAEALRAENEDLRSKNDDLRERLAATEASLELATSSLAAKATKFVKNIFFKESPTAKDAAPVPEDKDPRAQNKDLRAENEDLRERLAAAEASLELATSAESPAKAFVKRLFFKESSTAASKSEELLREQLAAAEASLAVSTTQAKESALENEDLREQLAAAESRAAAAEASLASFKESAANDAAPQSEVEALREQDESEDAKGHLRRLSECKVASYVQIFGNCYDPATTMDLRVPPRPRRPARRATAPRRRRILGLNDITGPIPAEIGLLTALKYLRVPPASPTPGAPRDQPSASQVSLRQRDHRPDTDQDRPAHGAAVPASSPRVPDARSAARPPLGVAGGSATTRSPARSRNRSACSRR
jgi:regulator of replication initiation timing